MTVSIDKSSVRLDVHVAAVKPRAEAFKVPVVVGDVHSSGAVLFDLTPATDSPKDLFAGISVNGTVKFLTGPQDSLDGWKVGFIQIVRLNACLAVYAGRTSSEGSIVCDALSGVLPNNIMLDSKDKSTVPWTYPPDETKAFKGPVASPYMGDGPHLSAPQSMQNGKVSNLLNFLLDFQWDTDFWTILTAIGPNQPPQYLAHFHWRVAHKVGCFWRSGNPHPAEGATSSFKMIDKFVSGPPKDTELQAILANPIGPIANDVAVSAFDKSIGDLGAKTHSELDRWFFSVPELRTFGIPGLFWA